MLCCTRRCRVNFRFVILHVVSGGHLCLYMQFQLFFTGILLMHWLRQQLAKVVSLLTLAHPELCSKETEMFECLHTCKMHFKVQHLLHLHYICHIVFILEMCFLLNVK